MLLIIIGLGILYMFNPIDYRWMPRCLVKQLTGLSCPGCGLMRAAYAALHGHFAEAVAYNYWLLLTVPYVLVLIMQRLMPAGRIKNRVGQLLYHRYTLSFYIVTFLAWFFIRNIYDL